MRSLGTADGMPEVLYDFLAREMKAVTCQLAGFVTGLTLKCIEVRSFLLACLLTGLISTEIGITNNR